MNTAEFARKNLEESMSLLAACAGGMNEAQYNWNPGGTANSAAKSHVHAASSVDFFINGLVRGEMQSLRWGKFAEKHGLPGSPLGIWAFEGTVPYEAMQEYAKEVARSAAEHVGTLSDADFDREIETQFLGKRSVAFLVQLAGTHAAGHGGDIAAIKGMQGLKGLPF